MGGEIIRGSGKNRVERIECSDEGAAEAGRMTSITLEY
jgi:hypothetical protein